MNLSRFISRTEDMPPTMTGDATHGILELYDKYHRACCCYYRSHSAPYPTRGRWSRRTSCLPLNTREPEPFVTALCTSSLAAKLGPIVTMSFIVVLDSWKIHKIYLYIYGLFVDHPKKSASFFFEWTMVLLSYNCIKWLDGWMYCRILLFRGSPPTFYFSKY